MGDDDALKGLPLDRVQVIEGDLLDPEFFETPLVESLQKRITRIVHVAASVNMDELVEIALTNNLLPGIRLYQWAQKCPLCTNVVITSTAFVNPPNDEPIYEGPCPLLEGIEIPQLTNFETLPPWTEMKGYHFTTYTFSKAALEHYLAYLHRQNPEKFKLSFVRPSIVSVAISDPYPGWNTSLDAVNGVIGLYACGLFSGRLKLGHLNVVPVDYVADSILAAAYRTSSDHLTYVHATASENQHIFTEALGEMVMDHGTEFYRNSWRQPKLRYSVNSGQWSRMKFHLIDMFPLACVSVLGTRKVRAKSKKTLNMLRSVYTTIISFYGNNVYNFHTQTPPAFEADDYMFTLTKGTFETLAKRGFIELRKGPAAPPEKARLNPLHLLRLCTGSS